MIVASDLNTDAIFILCGAVATAIGALVYVLKFIVQRIAASLDKLSEAQTKLSKAIDKQIMHEEKRYELQMTDARETRQFHTQLIDAIKKVDERLTNHIEQADDNHKELVNLIIKDNVKK